ncbi:ABC transporter permease, partial [Rhizobium johnstonii]
MDFTFIAATLVTLLKAVPTTLILFSLSIITGGLLALV